MLWYSQAGTPQISMERSYDPDTKTYRLTLSQFCPATPDMSDKKPMHIPVSMGLIAQDGRDLPLQLEGEALPAGTVRTLNLLDTEQSFVFVNIPENPMPSLFRGFSAPVKLKTGFTDTERAFLFACDSDEFNRWDAGQSLFSILMLRMISEYQKSGALNMDPLIFEPFRRTLIHTDLDKSFIALALTLPSESELAILMSESREIDPEAVHQVRRFVTRSLSEKIEEDLRKIYEKNRTPGPYVLNTETAGRRALKNLALSYLNRLEKPEYIQLAFEQFQQAENMTDAQAALSILSDLDCPERAQALERFYERWRTDELVLDKWFWIQAMSQLSGVLQQVKKLTAHPDFSIKNPNKVRALIGAFCGGNPRYFHDPSGEGYDFLTDRVLELDPLNPMIASRLAAVLNHWKKYEPNRSLLMKQRLERILNAPNLSKNTYEIVSKALKNQ
jgi:aminopeptidase N